MKISYISIIFFLFACHSDPKTDLMKSSPNHCFVKATQEQIDLTLHLIDIGGNGLDLYYSLGQAKEFVEIVGDKWEEFWKANPAGVLKQGDSIHEVDHCSQADISLLNADGSGRNVSPHIREGFISKIDLLLTGPPESIAANIKTVVIRRGGKRYRLTIKGLHDGKLILEKVSLGKK